MGILVDIVHLILTVSVFSSLCAIRDCLLFDASYPPLKADFLRAKKMTFTVILETRTKCYSNTSEQTIDNIYFVIQKIFLTKGNKK